MWFCILGHHLVTNVAIMKKIPLKLTTALRNSSRMEDILRRYDVCLLNDGRITMCSSLTKQKTSQCGIVGWSFKFVRSVDIWRCEQAGEHDFLMANAMWEPTNLLEDHKNIRCKWMCRTKKDALYKIVRFNA
jgi:hypothetical protein